MYSRHQVTCCSSPRYTCAKDTAYAARRQPIENVYLLTKRISLPFRSFPSPGGPRSGGCGYVVSEITFQKHGYAIHILKLLYIFHEK